MIKANLPSTSLINHYTPMSWMDSNMISQISRPHPNKKQRLYRNTTLKLNGWKKLLRSYRERKNINLKEKTMKSTSTQLTTRSLKTVKIKSAKTHLFSEYFMKKMRSKTLIKIKNRTCLFKFRRWSDKKIEPNNSICLILWIMLHPKKKFQKI